jgi:hypothetical protein
MVSCYNSTANTKYEVVCTKRYRRRKNKITEFSTWLLDIDDGNIKTIVKKKEEEPCWITIPHEYLLLPKHDKISCIVSTTFSDLQTNYADAQYIKDRAILTPTNDIADTINSHIVSVMMYNTIFEL